MPKIAFQVEAATRELAGAVGSLRFRGAVTHVYNPLDYARKPHSAYVRAYAKTPKRVLFLGMNPGPFGMAQTGVPFGDIESVRGWLGIEAPVGRPRHEHPKRPVLGFDCPRSEVSGRRLWGAIAEHFGTPGRFFRSHYIANFCPLVFIEASGRNRTPDKLAAREKQRLFAACDRHLQRLVEILDPRWVVGIGAFAADRASEALASRDVRIGRILHPSPANPRAQRDWAGQARSQLMELGVCRSRR